MPIQYAQPCVVCSEQYLDGSLSTCARCLRRGASAGPRRRSGIRFRCYCGRMAVAVMLVSLGHAEAGFTRERIPLCTECIQIEQETQRLLKRIRSRSLPPGLRAHRLG